MLLSQSIVADCKAIVQVFKEAETSTATGKLEAADALAELVLGNQNLLLPMITLLSCLWRLYIWI